MALNKNQLLKLETAIKNASKELNGIILVYMEEWVFDLPSQSIEINGTMIDVKYGLPIGQDGKDGYDSEDLCKLENKGVLSKLDESKEDPITFHKSIIYKLLS